MKCVSIQNVVLTFNKKITQNPKLFIKTKVACVYKENLRRLIS